MNRGKEIEMTEIKLKRQERIKKTQNAQRKISRHKQKNTGKAMEKDEKKAYGGSDLKSAFQYS